MKHRVHSRPVHGTEIRLYYPSLGEWLSLEEYQYRRTLNSVEQTSVTLTENQSFEVS